MLVLKNVFYTLVIVLCAVMYSFLGANGNYLLYGIDLFICSAILIFALHVFIFIPSYLFKTEFYYDLTGMLSCLSVLLLYFCNIEYSLRSVLLLGMLGIWSLRLGTFLFARCFIFGGDRRFDRIKKSWSEFLLAWMLSALWIYISAGCAFAAILSKESSSLVFLDYIFLLLWVGGFVLEVVSDWQKIVWKKSKPKDSLDFINTGLWSLSRHPNYLGEIIMWFAIAAFSFPNLSSWQYVTLISPFFVSYLLLEISGIPLLESYNDKRFANNKEYLEYKKNTPLLFLKIF